MRPEMPLALALAAVPAVACQGPEQELVPLRMGSLEHYVHEVALLVEVRCAQGGCHGRPERLLSLYAAGVHRIDPERRYLDEPLWPQEQAENARRIAAFAQIPDPRRSLLLCKPLARRAGGCWHGGGDNFEDDTDPAHRAILAWMIDGFSQDGGAP